MTNPDLQPLLEDSLAARGETPVTQVARYDEHMPAMTVEKAIQRKRDLIEFVAKVMIENHDFGVVPGTNKPTLLKPGAERLASYFGLSPAYQIIDQMKDWTGKEHNGEPLFAFDVKCILTRDGVFIGDADGHCNSWEKKYRWRQAGRTCPQCGVAAIRRSNYGGWYCYTKLDGCNAKFKDGDAKIESQTSERTPNPDIADAVNTILKMAEKRALIAAILNATNASEFFTQDEHFVEFAPDDDVPTETVEEVKERLLKQGPKASRAKEPPPNPVQEFDWELMRKELRNQTARMSQLRSAAIVQEACEECLKPYKSVEDIPSREEGRKVWGRMQACIDRWQAEDTAPKGFHGSIPEMTALKKELTELQQNRGDGVRKYREILQSLGAEDGKSSNPVFNDPERRAAAIAALEAVRDEWADFKTNPPGEGFTLSAEPDENSGRAKQQPQGEAYGPD